MNASSGGLDVVAKILNKYTHLDLGKAVMFAGMVTATSSILVYDIGILIVSLLGTYANGVAVDYFINGFHHKKRICIISDDYQRIQEHILTALQRGVTLYQAQGGYDREQRTELVTILDTGEYKQLLAWLREMEIPAFVTVYTVNEVIGTWNPDTRKRKRLPAAEKNR